MHIYMHIYPTYNTICIHVHTGTATTNQHALVVVVEEAAADASVWERDEVGRECGAKGRGGCG
jgi:S-adenosylmethionine/arginine decarboxylase-like enzyme